VILSLLEEAVTNRIGQGVARKAAKGAKGGLSIVLTLVLRPFFASLAPLREKWYPLFRKFNSMVNNGGGS
jgi:hypothetical protein